MDYRSNRVQVKNNSQIIWSLLLSFAFMTGGYLFLFPEDLSQFIGRINIGIFSMSHASDTAKSADPKEQEPAKSNKTTEVESNPDKERKPSSVSNNANYIEHLMAKETELSDKEKKLEEMEAKLQKEKDELQKKIDELEAARKEIAQRLEKRVVEDEDNVSKLVGVYSNMKPQNAAVVISKLDENLAVSVLKKMKKQDAGNILNFIDPAKAKVLSEKYSGY